MRTTHEIGETWEQKLRDGLLHTLIAVDCTGFEALGINPCEKCKHYHTDNTFCLMERCYDADYDGTSPATTYYVKDLGVIKKENTK